MHTEEKKNPNRAQKQLSNYKGRGKKKNCYKTTRKYSTKCIKYIPINNRITLNVNELYGPVKRHRIAKWNFFKTIYMFCLQETNFRQKNTKIEIEGMKNGIPCKCKEKESIARDFLEVPWLRLCTSTVGSTGLNPGLETKITDPK